MTERSKSLVSNSLRKKERLSASEGRNRSQDSKVTNGSTKSSEKENKPKQTKALETLKIPEAPAEEEEPVQMSDDSDTEDAKMIVIQAKKNFLCKSLIE